MKKVTPLFAILMFIILAGCSHEPPKGSDSGVVAVVNGVEITRQQVEYLYQRSAVPGVSKEESANLKRRILADLVRIELLAGKASEMKLDKTPDYSMALYTAQKNVLAGLAESRLAKNQSSITSEQAESVVQNTPQLFAGRKLFVYDEVLFPGVDMPLLESLDKMASNGATLNTLLDVLNAKKIPFRKTLIALSSERIPPSVLSILSQLKRDTPQLIARKGDKISMILVMRNAYPAPLEGEQARRAATAMLEANLKNQALSKAMSKLLDNAKITYYDEYAKTADGNKTLAPLPVPDTKTVTRKLYKSIYLGSGLAVSLILSVMMITAVMRTFYSMLWLPILWPDATTSANRAQHYDIRQTATLTRRLYLLGLMSLIGVALIFEILFLWNKLAVLALLGWTAGGIIAGVIASRLLNAGIIRARSRKTYMIIASFLAVLILVSVVMTIRLSHL